MPVYHQGEMSYLKVVCSLQNWPLKHDARQRNSEPQLSAEPPEILVIQIMYQDLSRINFINKLERLSVTGRTSFWYNSSNQPLQVRPLTWTSCRVYATVMHSKWKPKDILEAAGRPLLFPLQKTRMSKPLLMMGAEIKPCASLLVSCCPVECSMMILEYSCRQGLCLFLFQLWMSLLDFDGPGVLMIVESHVTLHNYTSSYTPIKIQIVFGPRATSRKAGSK